MRDQASQQPLIIFTTHRPDKVPEDNYEAFEAVSRILAIKAIPFKEVRHVGQKNHESDSRPSYPCLVVREDDLAGKLALDDLLAERGISHFTRIDGYRNAFTYYLDGRLVPAGRLVALNPVGKASPQEEYLWDSKNGLAYQIK